MLLDGDFLFVQTDESQSELVTEMLEEIIMEVISSNRKKPSIPGIILETIIDMVNGVIDVSETLPSKQSSAVSDEVLTTVAMSIVSDIVDEVLLSNSRQPSLSSIVLQLITEMITSSDGNNNEQTTKPPATTTQDGVSGEHKQPAEVNQVNKLMPSDAQQKKNAVRPEPMTQVCSCFCCENNAQCIL